MLRSNFWRIVTDLHDNFESVIIFFKKILGHEIWANRQTFDSHHLFLHVFLICNILVLKSLASSWILQPITYKPTIYIKSSICTIFNRFLNFKLADFAIISEHKFWQVLCNLQYIREPKRITTLESTLDDSNTDISKYPLISKTIVRTHFLFFITFQFLCSSTTDISSQFSGARKFTWRHQDPVVQSIVS